MYKSHSKKASRSASDILENARKEAENLKKESLLEAKDYRFQFQQEMEKRSPRTTD